MPDTKPIWEIYDPDPWAIPSIRLYKGIEIRPTGIIVIVRGERTFIPNRIGSTYFDDEAKVKSCVVALLDKLKTKLTQRLEAVTSKNRLGVQEIPHEPMPPINLDDLEL